jgi:hypothetical protein
MRPALFAGDGFRWIVRVGGGNHDVQVWIRDYFGIHRVGRERKVCASREDALQRLKLLGSRTPTRRLHSLPTLNKQAIEMHRVLDNDYAKRSSAR